MSEIEIHELKVLPEWYREITSGFKNFEIRRNDRYFNPGDYIILTREPNTLEMIEFARIVRRITYVLHDYHFPDGIQKGYCVLGLEKVETLCADAIIQLKDAQKKVEEAQQHRCNE